MQVKIKKGDTDLAIDQLREVFRVLAVDKVPTSKLEKRLDDLAHKWDEIKKVQPQVKSDVEPIQVGGGKRPGNTLDVQVPQITKLHTH